MITRPIFSAIAQAVASILVGTSNASYSPISLFATGEQGAWYEPESPATLVQRRNLVLWSEDFTNAAWVGYNGITKTTNTLTFVNNNSYIQQAVPAPAGEVGRIVVFSVTLSVPSGTAAIAFRLTDQADGTPNYTQLVNVTTTPTRYTFTVTIGAGASGPLAVIIQGNSTVTPGTVMTISNAQLEFGSTATSYQKVTDWNTEYLAAAGNNITMFQDSAGATPVTAVEQVVGLIFDKRMGLARGANLTPDDGAFTSSTGWNVLDAGWNISGGIASFAVADVAGRNIGISGQTVAGQTYEFTCTVTRTAGSWSFFAANTGDAARTTSGTVRGVYRADTTGPLVFLARAGFTGSIDDFQIRALPGNHAIQATTAQKPVLSARVNLLTKTEQFSDATVWVPNGTAPTVTANVVTAPDGTLTADRLVFSTIGLANRIAQVAAGLPNPTGPCTVQIRLRGEVGGEQIAIHDGWTVLGTATLTTDWQTFSYSIAGANSSAGIYLYAATGTPTVYAWGAQLERGAVLSTYQQVNTSTDYDTAGFPHYLKFDGVDDGLATAAINFSATDKASVFAGITKLSDAASAIIAELSAHLGLNAGAFALYGPNTAYTANNFVFGSRGTAADASALNAVFSPITLLPAVTASTHDIAGDLTTLRVNGLVGTSAVGDKGTGNFGNYPLYIGRRGGASLPFSGRIYSLIVRGAASSAEQITATEKHVATKTGVTLP